MMRQVLPLPDGDPDSPVPGAHIWGWMHEVELEWLGAQAAKMDSVCEIGVLHGRSAFALLTACHGPVYCVDPWDDERDHGFPSFKSFCGHFPNLNIVRGYSPTALEQVPVVDMTFIDGNHDYPQVIADITASLPKTRKLICGHDYQNADGGFPGVAEGVHELFPGRFYNPEGTSIWAVDL